MQSRPSTCAVQRTHPTVVTDNPAAPGRGLGGTTSGGARIRSLKSSLISTQAMRQISSGSDDQFDGGSCITEPNTVKSSGG